METTYRLRIGYSADGHTLHPSEADPEDGFPFPAPEPAQQEGNRLAGRTLHWVRNDANDTWAAIVGDGRVAEISEESIPVVSTNIGLMD